MKYFIQVQFSNGTTRFVTYADGHEWKADCEKPAYDFGSYEQARGARDSFGMMALHPNIIVIEDTEEVPVNQTLEDETFDEVIRLSKLMDERNKRKQEEANG